MNSDLKENHGFDSFTRPSGFDSLSRKICPKTSHSQIRHEAKHSGDRSLVNGANPKTLPKESTERMGCQGKGSQGGGDSPAWELTDEVTEFLHKGGCGRRN